MASSDGPSDEMSEISATSCVFCRILRGELSPGIVAFFDNYTAVFPSRDQQPRNQGHTLVVPVRHVARIYEVDVDLSGPLMTTLARVAAAVKNGLLCRWRFDSSEQ